MDPGFESKFFHATENYHITKGRKYGGLMWICNNKLNIEKCEFVNNNISILTVNPDNSNNDNKITIVGVYLTYNNNSLNNFNEFDAQLLLIENLIKNDNNTNNQFMIIGDFNANNNDKNKFNKKHKFVLLDP